MIENPNVKKINENPIAVAGWVWVTLKASTSIEKVDVAIKTPLPNAIIVVITFLDTLAKIDNRQPISKRLGAMKPNTKDSNRSWEVRISNHIESLPRFL